jgi:DNA-binding phage protein
LSHDLARHHFDTILKVISALGIKLHAEART